MLHKTRELLIKQRTNSRRRRRRFARLWSVNALRGHLSEFGIVAAKGSVASTSCSISPKVMRRFQMPPKRA